MKNILRKLLHLVNILFRIRQANINGALKRAISSAWVSTFFLNRYDKQNNTFKLSKYKIHFIDHHGFGA